MTQGGASHQEAGRVGKGGAGMGETAEIAGIAQRCEGAHHDKHGWRAKCPLHQGQSDTSLHLWEEEGHIRVHCFAGCRMVDVLAWLDIARPQPRQVAEAIYTYHTPEGHVLFQVVRMPGKSFFQRRPDPTTPGKYINKMNGVQRVLYRLPEVQHAIVAQLPIYLVEGEKDVETLRQHGLVATCNAGGAGKWDDTYSESLRHAEVILLPDNDKAGRDHARVIQSRLAGFVKSLTVLSLPDLPERGDVTDWLRQDAHD